MTRRLVIPMPGNEALAQSLARRLDLEIGTLEMRHFPDGESYLRYRRAVEGKAVILVCTLDRPDEKFLPLIFAAGAARDLGATEFGLVAPYLAYMRQDRRFEPGEAVTSAYFAKALGRWVDWLVTVDPHLHRRSDLSEIYAIPSAALHAAPLISAWIREHVPNAVLIGPDSESEQWVAAVAKDAGAPFVVLQKTRRGDRDVEVSVPHVARWKTSTPVLVDDIISTGRTMIETVGHLKQAGLPPPVCIGVHGIFAGSALQDLLDAGTERIITCNTIPDATNAIDVTELIAQGVRSTARL